VSDAYWTTIAWPAGESLTDVVILTSLGKLGEGTIDSGIPISVRMRDLTYGDELITVEAKVIFNILNPFTSDFIGLYSSFIQMIHSAVKSFTPLNSWRTLSKLLSCCGRNPCTK
jgi:hypothetical protein